MLISMSRIFNGRSVRESDHVYADRLWFEPETGMFNLAVVQCHSGIDGTCACYSHDTFRHEDLTPDEAMSLIREWGYKVQSEVDWSKVRRRIEDRLRKTNSPAQIYSVAGVLGVKID